MKNIKIISSSLALDNVFSKPHYVKGTAKAGQVFRLLAVFQDGSQDKTYSSQKDPINTTSSGREKERGRYAQLVGENRQVKILSLLKLEVILIINIIILDYLRVTVNQGKVL